MTVVDDVKARLDIVEVIQASGVELRRSGRNFEGFCPFHPNSRTPAFTVYPDSQRFHCFGCKASGSVFDFVMRKEGVTFRDALEQLAPKAGVTLDHPDHSPRRTLVEINAMAADFYHHTLMERGGGETGRVYLRDTRGLNRDTVEAFQLGVSLADPTALLRHLVTQSVTPEEAQAAGLVTHHAEHGWCDWFRNRVTFPIRNGRGEVVGFGGRALGDAQPKYLNTPETLLFRKGEQLYGLNLAHSAIAATGQAVIVEGYLDVVTAHQHGFRNVVAPLGTALTEQHLRVLASVTDRIVLALDGDDAGRQATLKSVGRCLMQDGLDVCVVGLPTGEDPDTAIRADPAGWQRRVAAAPSVQSFILGALNTPRIKAAGEGFVLLA